MILRLNPRPATARPHLAQTLKKHDPAPFGSSSLYLHRPDAIRRLEQSRPLPPLTLRRA